MSSTSLVTASLRDARLRLRQSLEAIADRVGDLARLLIEERTVAMAQVAADLDDRSLDGVDEPRAGR
jgi:hypothetical protein